MLHRVLLIPYVSSSRTENSKPSIIMSALQLKAGYLISLLNPYNYRVVRMYYRTTNAYDIDEFSRFQGAYTEQIIFCTCRTLRA